VASSGQWALALGKRRLHKERMSERFENRLAREASPYLQQHGHNPVDWYPWGEEALAKARAEDKPILLSIGYSACHWCHVMERESFEDVEIAQLMNDHFVSIKVDREQRPDLDHIYQLVVQLMGRSGGWPLTVFLMPDQRPFFAGTYFPPRDRHGMSGFPSVLRTIAEVYRAKRSDVEAQANELATALARIGASDAMAPSAAGPDLLERATRKLISRFDERHGGFGSRPKFPNTMCLDVLLRRAAEEGDLGARQRLSLALSAMRKGGIWDQLAGGFHRYSTDDRWLVPHFEKMLYDNALLLRLYTDAFRAFGDPSHADTARRIGRYLLAEMQSPEGGFYSAQDADSDGEEGKYFVWTEAEVKSVLAGDALASDVALAYFGITREGNFESTAANVLHENRPIAAVAQSLERSQADVEAALARASAKLLEVRAARTTPFRDDKILASWNGLVIAALAEAATALGEPSLLAAAERAYHHVEQTLVRGGEVQRFVKGGEVVGPGFLDDHAFVAAAALALYEATGDERRLAASRQIANRVLEQFGDGSGALFFTPKEGEKLLVRVEDPFDQAIPSGGAVAASVFLHLGALVDESFTAAGERYLQRVAAAAVENPFGFGQTIGVLDDLVRGSTDVVIVGCAGDAATDELRRVAFRAYLPNRNVVWADPERPASLEAAPLLAADKPRGATAVAYVCQNRTCSPPIADPNELRRRLAMR
jgi:uncharacterized protein YyaL (SSP411 family)